MRVVGWEGGEGGCPHACTCYTDNGSPSMATKPASSALRTMRAFYRCPARSSHPYQEAPSA